MIFESDPIAPVPIIHMHGLEDSKVSYEGGWLLGHDVLAPPVESVMEIWRAVNGCDENAT